MASINGIIRYKLPEDGSVTEDRFIELLADHLRLPLIEGVYEMPYYQLLCDTGQATVKKVFLKQHLIKEGYVDILYQGKISSRINRVAQMCNKYGIEATGELQEKYGPEPTNVRYSLIREAKDAREDLRDRFKDRRAKRTEKVISRGV